jgi:hypothetical protein
MSFLLGIQTEPSANDMSGSRDSPADTASFQSSVDFEDNENKLDVIFYLL